MSDLERHVSEAVERLRKERKLQPEAICVAAGFSRASYYVRLSQGGWRLAELDEIARLYDLPLTALIGDAFAPQRMVKMNCGPTARERTGRHLQLVKAA